MSDRFYGTPYRPSIMSPEIERAQSRLQQSERSFSRTQQELQQAMRVRASTPMSAIETSAKDQEIASLQQRLRQTETEMTELKQTIERQRMTIKTQSETISNPKQHFPTPEAHRTPGNPYGVPPPPPPMFSNIAATRTPPNPGGQARAITEPPRHQHQNSSPFNGPRTQHQPMRQQPRYQDNQPPPQFRGPRNVSQYGSPEALQQSFANMRISNTPVNSSRGSNQTPNSSATKSGMGMQAFGGFRSPPLPVFNPNNGMSLVPAARVAERPQDASNAIGAKFADVWHMAEMYAWAHVNTPSTQKDNAMSPADKQRVMAAASTTTAFNLMQTPFTRYMLVNKIILQFIIKTVLKHDTYAGFDPQADEIMARAKAQVYQTTPAQIKYQLLSTIGQQIKRIKSSPAFPEFEHAIVRHRGNELWAILKPMMHVKTSRDWDDLYELMLRAHELAEMMYSGADEFKFDFPVMGQPFRQDCMDPREPFENVHTPAQLEAMRVTVRLGMTPLITSRTSTAGGLVNSEQVLKAYVLLKTDR